MHTLDERIAHLKESHHHSREKKRDVNIPKGLLRRIAKFTLSNGSAETTLPPELVELARQAGVVVDVLDDETVRFLKLLTLDDPASDLVNLDEAGLQDVDDLNSVGDLVKFVSTGLGVLPYVTSDSGEELMWLYYDLKLRGFID